jgi:hypothetical protein
VDPAPGRVGRACELAQDLASLGDEAVAAQPCRPDPVRGYVAASLQFIQLRADRRRGQLLRLRQVLVRGLVHVQRGRRLRQLFRERRRFSTFWWDVITVRRFPAAACSRSAVCSRARRRPRRGGWSAAGGVDSGAARRPVKAATTSPALCPGVPRSAR